MRRRDALGLTAGAVFAGLLPRPVSAECQVFPNDGEVDFMALRHDQVVGHHRIRFSRGGGDFVVRSDVAIEVSAGATSWYRYGHHAEEVWRGGWLHSVVSDTDDQGLLYRVRAERRDGIFKGIANGVSFTVSGYLIPTSLWHHDTIAMEALFDVVDARVKLVRARRLGTESVSVRGAPVAAERYALTGEIRRNLWYDADCRLVRIGLLAPDGSEIVFEPR